nr:MAG TPA: hypothetical protein [Caudoviricetes sp.]
MTITNPDTGKPLKHYAQDEITKDRYIIIALQNETNPDECSVVKYDALDANMRAELLNAVNSDEFQKVPEIWKLLDKKYFYDYPKQTMLAVLRGLKQIKVVKQNQVRIELPGDITMTPKEIVNAIKQYESEKGKVLTKFRDTETPKVEEAKLAQMSDIEKRVDNLETKFDTLNNSITDLITAIKQQAKGE